MSKVCPICNEQFPHEFPNQRYCSPGCKLKARRLQKRKYQQRRRKELGEEYNWRMKFYMWKWRRSYPKTCMERPKPGTTNVGPSLHEEFNDKISDEEYWEKEFNIIRKEKRRLLRRGEL